MTDAIPDPRSYYNKGQVYWDAKNWVMAIGELIKAIQADPNLTDAYWDRAYSYSKLDQLEDSLDDYTKAIQLDPDLAWASNNRGLTFRNLGQTANADADDSKACSLDSQYC